MSFRNINQAKVATVKHINNLITCLVNIKDEDGTFLMTIPDGRIIDTKGWEDWEVRTFLACSTRIFPFLTQTIALVDTRSRYAPRRHPLV